MVQGNPNGKPKGAKDTKDTKQRHRSQLDDNEKAQRKATIAENKKKQLGQPEISGFFTAAPGGER